MRASLAVALFSTALFVDLAYAGSTSELAQMDIPNALSCSARHLANGQMVRVRQRPGPSMFWAHATWDPDGWPSITYGQAYFSLPPFMQRFTSAHECGHLVLQTTNEFHSNCYAIERLGLKGRGLRAVADFHRGIGLIGPQYGGTGQDFWALTERSCPDLAIY